MRSNKHYQNGDVNYFDEKIYSKIRSILESFFLYPLVSPIVRGESTRLYVVLRFTVLDNPMDFNKFLKSIETDYIQENSLQKWDQYCKIDGPKDYFSITHRHRELKRMTLKGLVDLFFKLSHNKTP